MGHAFSPRQSGRAWSRRCQHLARKADRISRALGLALALGRDADALAGGGAGVAVGLAVAAADRFVDHRTHLRGLAADARGVRHGVALARLHLAAQAFAALEASETAAH